MKTWYRNYCIIYQPVDQKYWAYKPTDGFPCGIITAANRIEIERKIDAKIDVEGWKVIAKEDKYIR